MGQPEGRMEELGQRYKEDTYIGPVLLERVVIAFQ
jgi:hypothetical protein